MTRHLVDPELRDLLDMIPTNSLDDAILPLARAAMGQMEEPVANYARPDVAIEERHVPGSAGTPDVRVVIYRPRDAAAPMPAYLNIHGGAYLMGKPETSGRWQTDLAAEVGCLVVSVDYRCAPEAPAPAAIEDCYAALAWLHGNAAALGVDPARIAIGGDSAGGGLAAALALLARDRGQIPIAFQLLIYPMLDDRAAVSTSLNPNVGQFIWNQASNLYAWRAYLEQEPGSAGVSPYAAPARAEDLSGLPPAYIGVGSLDLFLQEDIDYAQRLMAAGVTTELRVFPGAFHSFDRHPTAAIAKAATREFHAVLARALRS